jgi:hypothetical protein
MRLAGVHALCAPGCMLLAPALAICIVFQLMWRHLLCATCHLRNMPHSHQICCAVLVRLLAGFC